jgi:hypothetical protein
VADISSELPNVTFAGACVVGALLFLKVAILGGPVWPPANGPYPSRLAHIACAVIGAILLGLPFLFAWGPAREHPGTAPAPDPRVEQLQRDLLGLQGRIHLLEVDPSLTSNLISIDTEIRTLRAGVVAGDPNGSSCSDGTAGSVIPLAWLPDAQTPCQKLKNAQWTVLIQGYVNSGARALPAELRKLGIASVVGPAQPTKSPVATSSIGMVFDDDAPYTLICAIKDIYQTTTGVFLESVTTQRIYVNVARINTSSLPIRLGVPFSEFFDGNYHRMTPGDWDTLCAPSPAQQQVFEAWFADKATTFKAVVLEPNRLSAANPSSH